MLVAFTVITFGIAVCTPPISGPNIAIQGTVYPYTDVVSRFPRDYYWMYPAMLLMVIYLFFMAFIDHCASGSKKLFSRVALIFSSMSAFILTVNYFLQVSVIQPSLLNGEYDGISLLTQYNPHGIFIVAEEIGYIFMSLSLFFLALVFTERSRLQKALRWIGILCFALTVIAFVLISLRYGIMRETFLEIAVILINWTALIFVGIFAGLLFRQGMVKEGAPFRETC